MWSFSSKIIYLQNIISQRDSLLRLPAVLTQFAGAGLCHPTSLFCVKSSSDSASKYKGGLSQNNSWHTLWVFAWNMDYSKSVAKLLVIKLVHITIQIIYIAKFDLIMMVEMFCCFKRHSQGYNNRMTTRWRNKSSLMASKTNICEITAPTHEHKLHFLQRGVLFLR